MNQCITWLSRKKWVVVALICSMFFCFACEKKSKRIDQTKNEKIKPQSEPAASSEDSSNLKKILFIGDSLTEGYGVASESAFPALVEKKLNEKESRVKVINAGSSGSTTSSSLERLKWHLRSQPDLLFLALGANDGLRGVSIEVTEKNLKQTIELAQKNKLPIVLAGMKLPINYGEEYRKEFEDVYKKLAKQYRLKLIPFLLKDVGGQPELNLSDGIHPNEKGHRVIADQITPYIEKEI